MPRDVKKRVEKAVSMCAHVRKESIRMQYNMALTSVVSRVHELGHAGVYDYKRRYFPTVYTRHENKPESVNVMEPLKDAFVSQT